MLYKVDKTMPSHPFYENGGNVSSSSLSNVIQKSLFLQDEGKLKQLNESFNSTKKIFVTQQKIHEQSLVEIQALLSKAAELTSIISGVKNALLSENNSSTLVGGIITNSKSSYSKLNSNYAKRLHNLGDFVAAHKSSIAPSVQASSSQSTHSHLSSLVRSENVRFTESLHTSSNPVEVVLAEVVGMNSKTRSRMVTIAKLREDLENLRLLQSKHTQSKPGKYALIDEYDNNDDDGDNDHSDNNNDQVLYNDGSDIYVNSYKVSGGSASRSNLFAESNNTNNNNNSTNSVARIRERRMYRRALWTSAATHLSHRDKDKDQQPPDSTRTSNNTKLYPVQSNQNMFTVKSKTTLATTTASILLK